MQKTLEKFQTEGRNFLAGFHHALLADEPGLGKTLQDIAAVEVLGLRNNLVICPASVRLNWFQEYEECLGHTRGLEVISYDGARIEGVRAHLRDHYDSITLDEGHFLKTPESQRTKAVLGKEGLARRADYKWVLTGTPVLNRPRELYPVLKTLAPNFGDMSFAAFAQRYCGAYFDGRGINTKGATNLEELRGKLENFMLRRTKKEVFPMRREPMISRIPLELDAEDLAAVYAEEDLISNREAKISSVHEDFSALGDMARLLRLTGEAKVPAVCRFLTDLLETEEKVVVFAYHHEVIRRISEALQGKGLGPVVYHGGMSDAQKENAVKTFKTEKSRVFIGQIKAAGTGINGLQEVCSVVAFAELSWVPGEVGQAIDRLDRMGQRDPFVRAYFLHAPGTLESAVLGVHDGKAKVIERLMGRGEAPVATATLRDNGGIYEGWV